MVRPLEPIEAGRSSGENSAWFDRAGSSNVPGGKINRHLDYREERGIGSVYRCAGERCSYFLRLSWRFR